MHRQSAVAVALLAAAPFVAATGNAVVHNQCNFPVYLWTVTNTPGEMQTLDAGESYSNAYQVNPNGGGVSVKLATNPSSYGAITQFEYTLDSTLWYDVSNINGNPFMKYGLKLLPSVSSCRTVVCAAGVETCDEVYNTPDENEATAACTPEANTKLVLCPGQYTGGASDVSNVVSNDTKHKHKKEHKHKSDPEPSVPAPAPVPAPVTSVVDPVAASVTQAASGPITTFVTEIVTITARDAEPSPMRRHVHQHHYNHHH